MKTNKSVNRDKCYIYNKIRKMQSRLQYTASLSLSFSHIYHTVIALSRWPRSAPACFYRPCPRVTRPAAILDIGQKAPPPPPHPLHPPPSLPSAPQTDADARSPGRHFIVMTFGCFWSSVFFFFFTSSSRGHWRHRCLRRFATWRPLRDYPSNELGKVVFFTWPNSFFI